VKQRLISPPSFSPHQNRQSRVHKE